MHPTAIVLFTTTVLLQGVSCHLELIPRGIPRMMAMRMELSKRQDAINVQQCVIDKVDAAFVGNNSRFASDCKAAVIGEFEITALELTNTGDSHFQSLVNTVYRTFCVADCGNVILDAYTDCGVFDQELPVSGLEEFTVGLCGTNRNGTFCYEMIAAGMNLIFTEATCYSTALSTETCTCSAELSEAVQQQDCCINIYHKLISGVQGSTYSPPDLYYTCNVELPSGCNNTPLTIPTTTSTDQTDSTSPVPFISIITLIFTLICSAIPVQIAVCMES